MWRYVKRTRPARSRPYSDEIGSFTLSRSSDFAQTSSTEPMRAPTFSYAVSGNELPSPAPVSTSTSWPRWASSRAPAGVRATRYSSVLISLATPIFIAGRATIPRSHRRGSASAATACAIRPRSGTDRCAFSDYARSGWWAGVPRAARVPSASVARVEVEQKPCDRLRILELGDEAAQLRHRDRHELDRLVRLLASLPLLDAFGDEEPHALSAEARRRVEGRQLAPGASGQAGLLLQLALRGHERLLALRQRPRRQLEQLLPGRLPQLPHERHPVVIVDRDDCDRPGGL